MKKFYASLITLMLLVSLFSTVAYAWISLATVNNIENLSLSARGNDYLEISLDGINYSNNIDLNELNSLINKIRFKDITSFDGINFIQGHIAPKEARENIDYMSLTLHFRTDTPYVEVHLANNLGVISNYNNLPPVGTYIVSKGISSKLDTTFQYDEKIQLEKGSINTFYASEAMRISISEVDSESNELNNTKIFDLSNNPMRGYGMSYGALSYYNNKRHEFIKPPELAPKTIYELSSFSETDPVALNDNSKLITLKESDTLNNKGRPYYTGVVKLNIWLEGWDADAFDAIYEDQLKMQFEFASVMTGVDNN